MRERIETRWDIHEKNAPYSSDRWASSDRGWLFADILPKRGACSVYGTTYVCLGHYLDYETANHERVEGMTVHAVSCVTRESRYCATPSDARAWLEERARGKIGECFASAHNGYEHRKAEIRRMPATL